MDVKEAIRTILAVRSFEDRPVPREVIDEILEAGRLTASSMNKQPWHFVAVRERAQLQKLADIATTGPYIVEAPLAIVVAVERAKWSLSDASRAVQDMMLTAWAEGVGSNWVGFVGQLSGVNEVLGIPAELDVVTIVPFGYPAAHIGKGKKNRKPVAELVHWGKWGVHETS